MPYFIYLLLSVLVSLMLDLRLANPYDGMKTMLYTWLWNCSLIPATKKGLYLPYLHTFHHSKLKKHFSSGLI